LLAPAMDRMALPGRSFSTRGNAKRSGNGAFVEKQRGRASASSTEN
jgi:hypothetical protein